MFFSEYCTLTIQGTEEEYIANFEATHAYLKQLDQSEVKIKAQCVTTCESLITDCCICLETFDPNANIY